MAGPLVTRRDALRSGALVTGALVAGALAGGLSGCDGGDENVPAEPVSVNPSEGKLGGKLVLYTSCSESLVNAVVPAFMEELGVSVSVVRGTTGELTSRVAEDAAAGRRVADVLWGGNASWYAGMGEAGLLEKHVSAGNGSMRAGCGCAGGTCTPVTREVVVIALGPEQGDKGAEVDAESGAVASGDDASAVADAEAVAGQDGTDAMAEGDDADSEASDDADLADVVRATGYRSLVETGVPGGVALEAPETSDAGLAFAASVDVLLSRADADEGDEGAGAEGVDSDGSGASASDPAEDAPAADLVTSDPNAPWEYLRELLGVATVVSEDEAGDGEAALGAVLLGDAGAAIAFEQACLASAREGHDLEVVYPEEGLAVTRGCTAVVEGCENLEQARAWVDFVTGQACQQLIASEALGRPVRGDVGDPEGLPEVGEVVEVDRDRLVATWAAVADGSWEPTE